MKALPLLKMVLVIVLCSIFTLPALAGIEPSVGVKEGDWIEY